MRCFRRAAAAAAVAAAALAGLAADAAAYDVEGRAWPTGDIRYHVLGDELKKPASGRRGCGTRASWACAS